MRIIKSNSKLCWQFIKFCMVGVSNNLIGLSVYYIFILIRNNFSMAIAGLVLGWILGVTNAFFWNRNLVFKEKEEKWYRALVKVYIAYFLSLLMALVLTYVQIQVLNISALIVPLINLAITTPMNFCVSKYWVFKRSRNENGRIFMK